MSMHNHLASRQKERKQQRILYRDAVSGRTSEGTSTDTFFSADPVRPDDLATKSYVDALIERIERLEERIQKLESK